MTRWIRTIWYVLTLRCEEADRLRSVRFSGELTRAERVGESLHTALCRSCRNARRQVERLDRALQEISDAPEGAVAMPAEARDRIAAGLRDRIERENA